MLGARALVLPSFAEGLPVVIMEALALGRPVIATSISGISELVDRETGWIIPAGSVTALADAMIAALETPTEQLRAMGDVGRERVRAGHDIDDNVADLADLLRPLA
jgi:glycosyltransferase involved in cell wall biosynthesis